MKANLEVTATISTKRAIYILVCDNGKLEKNIKAPYSILLYFKINLKHKTLKIKYNHGNFICLISVKEMYISHNTVCLVVILIENSYFKYQWPSSFQIKDRMQVKS